MTTLKEVKDLIEGAGGQVHEVGEVAPGDGYAVASFPLPKDHWLTREGHEKPPMPMRVGVGPERTRLAEQVRAAARYAIRASTMNGRETDFDPDSMVQNMVVGMLGYWTDDGLSTGRLVPRGTR